MAKTVKGKEVLEALSVYKEPVTMDEIVRYVAEASSQPEEKVKKLVEETLNGGVRYGFVQKHNEFYYRVCDAVDAINESSEEDEEDEVESAESYESVDSGDLPPEAKTKKNIEGKSGSRPASSLESEKPKKGNKRAERWSKKAKDVCSDEEEEYKDEQRKRSHKCNSDCYNFHRKRSMDDHCNPRARSRSGLRRR